MGGFESDLTDLIAAWQDRLTPAVEIAAALERARLSLTDQIAEEAEG